MQIDETGKRVKTGGRKAGTPNKATAAIRELAGSHAESAIKTLVEIMENVETAPAARVAASKELIERGFGRSGSYMELSLETPLSELSPSDAIATIGDKVTTGALSIEDGQRLVTVIEARMKAIQHTEFEERLKRVEKAEGKNGEYQINGSKTSGFDKKSSW